VIGWDSSRQEFAKGDLPPWGSKIVTRGLDRTTLLDPYRGVEVTSSFSNVQYLAAQSYFYLTAASCSRGQVIHFQHYHHNILPTPIF